jgi:hypothetical protein
MCLERILGKKQAVGAVAHRGTAVEAGVAVGLADPAADPKACVEAALAKYDTLMALSGDPRKDDVRKGIPAMVELALDELRPYGIPTRVQDYIEWRPEGLHCPIVGYLDFAWDQHGILTDLKTTEACPSQIRTAHARQVALYASSDNMAARVTYVTPKKRATYEAENLRDHRAALHRIALACERFLALSRRSDVLRWHRRPRRRPLLFRAASSATGGVRALGRVASPTSLPTRARNRWLRPSKGD